MGLLGPPRVRGPHSKKLTHTIVLEKRNTVVIISSHTRLLSSDKIT